MFNVKISSAADKQLEKLDSLTRSRIIKTIEKIALDPFSYNHEKMEGCDGVVHRYRVGNYRIIADIHKKELLIIITKISNRKNVYR